MLHLLVFVLVLFTSHANAAVLHVPVKKVTSPALTASLLPQYAAIRRSPVFEPFRLSLVDESYEDHDDLPVHNTMGEFYLGHIQLGSPPQDFRVFIDVTSSDLWVPNRNFFRNHAYDHSKSTTYKANGTWIDMGIIAGIISEDTLQLGSLQVPGMSFVEVNQTQDRHLFESDKFDGFLGLGFDALSLAHMESPFHQMVRSGVLDEPVVAFDLQDLDDGIVTFGGVTKDHFRGELAFVDVVGPKYWAFAVDAVKSRNTKLTSVRTAVFTTAPYIYGPRAEVAALARAVGAKEFGFSGVYSIDCSAPAFDIVFVINGKEYALDVNDYIIDVGYACLWAVRLMDVPMFPDEWVLGNVFTRKFYTVLDYGTSTRKPRVGFAPANKGPVPSGSAARYSLSSRATGMVCAIAMVLAIFA